MLERLWNGWRAAYVTSGGAVGRGRRRRRRGRTGQRVHAASCASGLPDAETHIVHRGDHVFAILNAFPYAVGHLLVLPYREVGRPRGADRRRDRRAVGDGHRRRASRSSGVPPGGPQRRGQPRPAGRRQRQRAPARARRAALDRRRQLHDGRWPTPAPSPRRCPTAPPSCAPPGRHARSGQDPLRSGLSPWLTPVAAARGRRPASGRHPSSTPLIWAASVPESGTSCRPDRGSRRGTAEGSGCTRAVPPRSAGLGRLGGSAELSARPARRFRRIAARWLGGLRRPMTICGRAGADRSSPAAVRGRPASWAASVPAFDLGGLRPRIRDGRRLDDRGPDGPSGRSGRFGGRLRGQHPGTWG